MPVELRSIWHHNGKCYGHQAGGWAEPETSSESTSIGNTTASCNDAELAEVTEFKAKEHCGPPLCVLQQVDRCFSGEASAVTVSLSDDCVRDIVCSNAFSTAECDADDVAEIVVACVGHNHLVNCHGDVNCHRLLNVSGSSSG